MAIYQAPFMFLHVLPAYYVDDCLCCCPRLYFAACQGSRTEDWRGASLWESIDDTTFEEIAAVIVPATSGYAETALANAAYVGEFDETNTVTVTLGAGTLANATEAECRTGKNWAVLGAEVFGFCTATLSYTGTYVLSNLLRGRRGTSGAAGGHAIGESFTLLSEDGAIIGKDYQSKDSGATRYFRAVAAGGAVADATSQSLAVPVAAGEVRSVAHGFVAGDVLYASGAGTLAKAKADASGTTADFVVVAVPSLDVVLLAATGRYRVPAHGKTSGSTYYLDASTAGATTTTAPSTGGQYVQPVYLPADADTLLVNVGNAIVVP